MREMEGWAYLLGNGYIFRDFEDGYKSGDIVMNEWQKKEDRSRLKTQLLKEVEGPGPLEKGPEQNQQKNKDQKRRQKAP